MPYIPVPRWFRDREALKVFLADDKLRRDILNAAPDVASLEEYSDLEILRKIYRLTRDLAPDDLKGTL